MGTMRRRVGRLRFGSWHGLAVPRNPVRELWAFDLPDARLLIFFPTARE